MRYEPMTVPMRRLCSPCTTSVTAPPIAWRRMSSLLESKASISSTSWRSPSSPPQALASSAPRSAAGTSTASLKIFWTSDQRSGFMRSLADGLHQPCFRGAKVTMQRRNGDAERGRRFLGGQTGEVVDLHHLHQPRIHSCQLRERAVDVDDVVADVRHLRIVRLELEDGDVGH